MEAGDPAWVVGELEVVVEGGKGKMSDFEVRKQNAIGQQMEDPAELQEALKLYQELGNISEPLWGWYQTWKRSGGSDPNEFVKEMNQIIPELQNYRGMPVEQEAGPPGNPPVQTAGPGKWPGWGGIIPRIFGNK